MVAQLTGAEGPVSVRAMHVASPGQNYSGGGQSMHRVIAARRPFARTEAALSAMRAHTTRPRPRSTPTFAPLRSEPAGPSDSSVRSGTENISRSVNVGRKYHCRRLYRSTPISFDSNPKHKRKVREETYRVAASAGGI